MKKQFVACALALAAFVLAPLAARAAKNSHTPGTIKSIDAAAKTFVIVRQMDDNTTKDVAFKVTPETTYKILEKDGTFADLKVGQKILCENQKTEGFRTAIAIKVTEDAPAEKPAEAKPETK